MIQICDLRLDSFILLKIIGFVLGVSSSDFSSLRLVNHEFKELSEEILIKIDSFRGRSLRSHKLLLNSLNPLIKIASIQTHFYQKVSNLTTKFGIWFLVPQLNAGSVVILTDVCFLVGSLIDRNLIRCFSIPNNFIQKMMKNCFCFLQNSYLDSLNKQWILVFKNEPKLSLTFDAYFVMFDLTHLTFSLKFYSFSPGGLPFHFCSIGTPDNGYGHNFVENSLFKFKNNQMSESNFLNYHTISRFDYVDDWMVCFSFKKTNKLLVYNHSTEEFHQINDDKSLCFYNSGNLYSTFDTIFFFNCSTINSFSASVQNLNLISLRFHKTTKVWSISTKVHPINPYREYIFCTYEERFIHI